MCGRHLFVEHAQAIYCEIWMVFRGPVCAALMCWVCIRDDQLFNLIIFDDIWTKIHKYSFKRVHTHTCTCLKRPNITSYVIVLPVPGHFSGCAHSLSQVVHFFTSPNYLGKWKKLVSNRRLPTYTRHHIFIEMFVLKVDLYDKCDPSQMNGFAEWTFMRIGSSAANIYGFSMCHFRYSHSTVFAVWHAITAKIFPKLNLKEVGCLWSLYLQKWPHSPFH